MMARKSKIDEDYEELSVAADPWKTGDVHGKVGDVHDIRTFEHVIVDIFSAFLMWNEALWGRP